LLARKRERLWDILARLRSALVAFSGGVDSTFLLHEARQVLGERVLAVTASSPIHPQEEVERARWLAREMGVAHLVMATSELDLPGFSSNPPDRCYLCKRALLGLLWERWPGAGGWVACWKGPMRATWANTGRAGGR
jgi:uncharacterized protein